MMEKNEITEYKQGYDDAMKYKHKQGFGCALYLALLFILIGITIGMFLAHTSDNFKHT